MTDFAALCIEKFRRREGLIFVLSGPSGVGKDSLLKKLLKITPNIEKCITTTSRKPRGNEINGKDYWFCTTDEFHQLIETGGFLEYARVHGNLYGVQRKHVDEILASGRDVFLLIDVQGAAAVKNTRPETILIFLSPPTMAELERRLRDRGTETDAEINKRLIGAAGELERIQEFDYLVVNDQIDRAAAELAAVVTAERCKIERSI